jgi:hypothetical protein
VVRREHHAEAGQHDVERAVGARQRFGVAFLPPSPSRSPRTWRTMVQIWRGDLGWSAALGAEKVRIEGPLRRAVPSWFALSPFAAVPRPRQILNPRVDKCCIVVVNR